MAQRVELTAGDVAKLLADPSANARAETAAKVAASFGPELNPTERALARDIVAALARDAETQVRRALAENLKDNPDLPRDLALRLARDTAEVAAPILAASPVFSDADLVELLRAVPEAHQEAIASRASVSAEVSTVLVERGTEKAVARLMANPGADVPDPAYSRALERFPDSGLIGQAMAGRAHLPLAVAERLIALVTEAMREKLVKEYKIAPELAADLLMQSRERVLIGLIQQDGGQTDARALAQELKRQGRLTPSLILRALSGGDIDFFEQAVAAMAGVPVINAHVLLHDPGRRGLVALCRQAGLNDDALPLIESALWVAEQDMLDGGPDDRARFVERVIERLLTLREAGFEGGDLEPLLARLGKAQAAQRAAN